MVERAQKCPKKGQKIINLFNLLQISPNTREKANSFNFKVVIVVLERTYMGQCDTVRSEFLVYLRWCCVSISVIY